jgi:cell division protein FtsI (penicillin-binding protein 3)
MRVRKRKKSERTLPRSISQWRLLVLVLVLLFIALGLIARLINLTVINRQFLQNQGNARTIRRVTIPAHRGMILDRHGVPLAISTPVNAVWIDPSDFKPSAWQLARLSTLL